MDAPMTRSVTQTPSRWRTHSVTSLTHSRLWPRGVCVCVCVYVLGCLCQSLNYRDANCNVILVPSEYVQTFWKQLNQSMRASTVSYIRYARAAVQHTCGFMSAETLDKANACAVSHVYVRAQ